LSDEFQAGTKLLMEQYGQSLGYEVRALNANNQATTQVSQLDVAITQHPKAIIVAAVDSSTIITGVEKARAAGIKVVVFDRFITDTPSDFTSATGTTKIGEITAADVGRLLTAKNGGPHGTVLEIMGDLGDQYTVTVSQGFNATMAAQFPDVQITTKNAPGYDTQTAVSILETQLAAGKKPDLVFLHIDPWAPAVIAALQAHNISKGDIIMVSGAGTPTGLQAIRDGWLTETVEQALPQQIWGVWQFMPDVLAGKAIQAGPVDVKGLPSEVKVEKWGPTLYLPGDVINSTNVDNPNLWGNMKVVVQP